jgi:superfamily II DNA/RNA helicase
VIQKYTKPSIDEEIRVLIHNAGYQHPTALQSAAIPLSLTGKDCIIETIGSPGKTAAILITLLMGSSTDTSSLILTSSADKIRKIKGQWRNLTLKSSRHKELCSLGLDDDLKKELKQLSSDPGIIVSTGERFIDHLRRNNLYFKNISTVAIDVPEHPEEGGFDKDIQFIYSKLSKKVQTILYASNHEDASCFEPLLRRPQVLTSENWDPQESELLQTLQETKKVAMKRKEFSLNEDSIKMRIQTVIKHIKEDENPDELNAYKKLIRRYSPITLRSYITAYLLKEASGSPITGGQLKTLFISVGKNRRIYPKDLVKLFSSALHIDQSEIKNIKVLENYSFLEIPDKTARKAIDILDGSDFRGRRITVNFAKKREERK